MKLNDIPTTIITDQKEIDKRFAEYWEYASKELGITITLTDKAFQ